LITIFALARLLSNKKPISGSGLKDILAGLLWPVLPLTQAGRSFIKQLVKG
jgi:hypothetical protein